MHNVRAHCNWPISGADGRVGHASSASSPLSPKKQARCLFHVAAVVVPNGIRLVGAAKLKSATIDPLPVQAERKAALLPPSTRQAAAASKDNYDQDQVSLIRY